MQDDLESKAKWAHPHNQNHQKKWIEAIKFLQSRKLWPKVVIGAQYTGTINPTEEPETNGRKD